MTLPALTEDEKPVMALDLSGSNGNAFAVVGQVAKGLRLVGRPDYAAEMQKRALEAHSYDALVGVCREYIVEPRRS